MEEQLLQNIKKYKVGKNLKLQTKSSEELLDVYDQMVYEAVFRGEKAADIPTKIHNLLGINVKILREAQELTGRKNNNSYA